MQQGLVQHMSGRRSVWVRDQKAASRMIWKDLNLITSTKTQAVLLPYQARWWKMKGRIEFVHADGAGR